MALAERIRRNLFNESLSPETIIRVSRHERAFLTIANSTVQDARLSWEARGLLIYLLSLPTDWDIRVSHLVNQGNAGRDAVRRMLRELQECGYVSGIGRESQERGERGRFGQNEIRVYETPSLNPFLSGSIYSEPDSPSPENPSTAAQPSAVSPSPDSPSPENPSTYKEQNLQKTEETKAHAHTHTTRARATAAQEEPESANAGVGVNSSKSRFSFEERKAHALANSLGPGWLNNSRDGRYDEMIADQIARSTPEAIEQALAAAAAPKFKPYGAALMHVASVVARGGVGSEPAPEIERLFEAGEIDGATRERLLARDWTLQTQPKAEVPPWSKAEQSMDAVKQHLAKLEEKKRAQTVEAA